MAAATVAAETQVPAELLTSYLEIIEAAVRTGRRPDNTRLIACRQHGNEAATRGIALRTVINSCLRVTELAAPGLPGLASAPTPTAARSAAVALVATVRHLVDALTEGYEHAQAEAALAGVSDRRQFTYDLLNGSTSPGRLVELAHRFGIQLAGRHQVLVARLRTGSAQLQAVAGDVEDRLTSRFGRQNVLVASQNDLLVCVTSGTLRGAAGELAHHLLTALGVESDWQIGVGRPHLGPRGVQESYEEARDALTLADRLGLAAPVLRAADLLVFPVLLRDRGAITDLVESVLAPLIEARGGAGPMLETLSTYFDSHGNTNATARLLSLSPRAVAYRLERVRRLTGYDPDDPTQRFTLQTAVLGARLLGWPES
ncbi:helix-turn-helix domain-containing protein [Phytohabitans flavus]|uniref:Transcriptional regulator n=1 Tax=Phytohabitans flavus TaxID=1076124 RepID=A0A6F8XM27_9ACTN|nr:hypothetical protein Pflav_012820 [Phytohabitans flavus]